MSTPATGSTPGLMPIGMFSRATLLSVKQLRRYHEQGILVPAAIDPVNGYRLYDVAQVHDASLLVRLRALEVPMSEVARVLAARDPAVTAEVLGSHRRALRERQQLLDRAIAEVEAAISAPSTHTPTHVRTMTGTAVLEISGQVEHQEFAEFLSPAFDELEAGAAAGGYQVTGPSMASYPPEVTEVEHVVAMLPVSGPGEVSGRIRTGRLTGGHYAVNVHHGSYESLSNTYGLLGAWVATHATGTGGRIIESYLTDPDRVSDPSQLRTEIWWPITEAAATHKEKSCR